MTQELRRLAEAAVTKPIGNMLSATEKSSRWTSVYESRVALSAACTPAAILSLLDRLEKAEKDAECFLLWVHEAWHSPSDIMKLLNNCETPEDYRAKLLPIIAAKKAAITGAMEASK